MAGRKGAAKINWKPKAIGEGRFGTTGVSSGNGDGAGLSTFEYAVPSGFYSLCTKNIKDYG